MGIRPSHEKFWVHTCSLLRDEARHTPSYSVGSGDHLLESKVRTCTWPLTFQPVSSLRMHSSTTQYAFITRCLIKHSANLKPLPQHLLMDKQPWPRQNAEPRTLWHMCMLTIQPWHCRLRLHGPLCGWATSVPATDAEVAWQDMCSSDISNTCPSPCLILLVKPTESQFDSWHYCGSCEHSCKTLYDSIGPATMHCTGHWLGEPLLCYSVTLLVKHISSIWINRTTMRSCCKFRIYTTTNDRTLYSFPHYTLLWPEDGPQWLKNVVISTINRI